MEQNEADIVEQIAANIGPVDGLPIQGEIPCHIGANVPADIPPNMAVDVPGTDEEIEDEHDEMEIRPDQNATPYVTHQQNTLLMIAQLSKSTQTPLEFCRND